MTNANKLLTQGERNRITEIKEREGDRPLENLFLVVNFMDNLDSDGDRKDVQILANSIVKDGSITGKDRIHFISARSALKATLSNTSNEYLVSFQNFTRTLEAFLTDERGSIILQSATQKLNELTQDCVNELNNATNSINTNLAASYKEEILERIGEASGRFVTIRKMVDFLRKQTTDLALVSWQENSAKFQARIEQRSKEWKTDHNPLFSRDSLIQDYVGQFSQSLQGEINSWVQFHLNNEIISPKLNLLDRGIKEELEALNSSFSGLDRKVGTNFNDNFSPAFKGFDASYVGAWAAGGVVGGGAGAAAAFFMIPALALGPAVIIGIAAAALLGGGGLWASMSDAYYQIGKQVCDSGFEEFKKSEDGIKEKIGEFIDTLFDNRIQSVDTLIKQVISECENRLEIEERKQQEEGDRLRSLISSKKQEFEDTLRR